jgi:hypothetical protein
MSWSRADLDRKQRDPARVALGRAVVGAEAHHQRADPRAEVGLLGRDHLGRAQVADERARAAAAAQIERDRDAEQQDPGDLEDMAQVEAEGAGRAGERRDRGHGEPAAADRHDEVVGAARQRECPHRAVREQPEQHETDRHQSERGAAAALRHRRHERGPDQPRDAEGDHGAGEGRLEGEQPPHPARTAQTGQRGQREDRCAGRQREAARERDGAVHPDQHARRREPVDGEHRGHRGERGAEERGLAVLAAHARRGDADGGERGDQRGDADQDEVAESADGDVRRADGLEHGAGEHGRGAEKRQRSGAVTEHAGVIGMCATSLAGCAMRWDARPGASTRVPMRAGRAG